VVWPTGAPRRRFDWTGVTFSRVLIPVIGFVPAGGNRVLCCLATEFVRLGIEVDFLVLDAETRPPFSTAARVIYANTIDSSCIADRVGGKWGIVRNIVRLARAIRQAPAHYDLVLASYSFVALACAIAGRGRRTLYYVQSYDPEILATKRKLSSRIGAALAYVSYWLCRSQVVNSPHYLGYSGISATDFVPPGVDTAVFYPRQSAPELLRGAIRIGIIGRSEPHKYRPVVDAFRAIRQRNPDCVLVVAYGNVPADVLASAGTHEIVVPRNDVELAAFYRSCDVFLALSEFAVGAFYPPLEALATGTLLISNRFLYVNEDNSWVVDGPRQVPAAFETLLACSPEEREARRSRGIDDIARQLPWPHVAKQLLALAEHNPGPTKVTYPGEQP
jgi:glycosyltransferase involved in cell wall biosynthesis